MDKNNPTAMADQMSYYIDQKAALNLSPLSGCVTSNKKQPVWTSIASSQSEDNTLLWIQT